MELIGVEAYGENGGAEVGVAAADGSKERARDGAEVAYGGVRLSEGVFFLGGVGRKVLTCNDGYSPLTLLNPLT